MKISEKYQAKAMIAAGEYIKQQFIKEDCEAAEKSLLEWQLNDSIAALCEFLENENS